jgi:hypothetical protein
VNGSGKPPFKVTKGIMARRLNKGLPTMAIHANDSKDSSFAKPGNKMGGIMQKINESKIPSGPKGSQIHSALSRKLNQQNVKK